MICPRCSVAEIDAETHQCVLCGYAPGGVILETGARDELDEAARQELVSQFQLGAILARGPRSVVYVARETDTERRVALRVLSRRSIKDAGLEDRFQREAAAAAALDHPHIVPIHRFGSSASLLWCSMKFVEGRSLADILRDQGPLELGACLRLVEQVASALQYAHRRGVVHGDVRPANILVDEAEWGVVTDFALGRVLDRIPTLDGSERPARPPDYIAPEEGVARHPAPAADQFALAVTVWECLTGTLPFGAATPAAVAAQKLLPPSTPTGHPALPGHVGDVLARALSARPADRFPTVLEFVSALSAGDAAPAAPFTPAPAPRRSPRHSRNQRVLLVDNPTGKRRWLLGSLAVVVVLGMVVAGLLPLFYTDPTPAAGPMVNLPAPATTRTGVPPLADSLARRPAPAPAAPATAAAPRPAPRPSVPAPPAAAPGRLFINATPWGQLYIDDVLIGNTPQVDLTVSPGSHRLRVMRDGFRTFETRLQVAPGQEIRLTDIVLEALVP